MTGRVSDGAFTSPTREASLQLGPTDAELSFFWSRVHKTPTCWLWMGDANYRGYGSLSCRGKTVLAHRLSWRIHTGSAPGYSLVCHECDTPQCVRPDHLFLGTHKVNLDDAAGKARMAKKLSEEDVAQILRLVSDAHPVKQVAKMFGVQSNSITAILKGKCWLRAMNAAKEAGFFSKSSQPTVQASREIPSISFNTANARDVSSLDRLVCQRIRARRQLLQISQEDLALAVGVTYQQMHKYETGKNRITASRLFQIAHSLRVPIGFFFEDLQPEEGRAA